MTPLHAWFSPDIALRQGSRVFRKPDGGRVNVTRLSEDRQQKVSQDEIYVGSVVREEDGGCVTQLHRVRGITTDGPPRIPTAPHPDEFIG